MRKILALSGVVLTSLLFTGSAFAQGAAPPAPAGGAAVPATDSGGSDDKKMTLGIDAQFMLPLGDFGKAAGPQIGPLVRFGYRVIPALELTGRVGYLFGLSKEVGPFKSSLSNIPIWVGARYFFMDAPAGFYGAAELAINLMSAKIEAGGQSASTSVTREGINLGVGYVISKELPIDLRAQFSLLNLLGKETNETSFTAIGISAGYSFFF